MCRCGLDFPAVGIRKPPDLPRFSQMALVLCVDVRFDAEISGG